MGDWITIITHFLNRHNDYISLHIKIDNDVFIVTDDGSTLTDLELCGWRDTTLVLTEQVGVEADDKTLFVRASFDDFPRQTHNLIQTILAMNKLGSATLR